MVIQDNLFLRGTELVKGAALACQEYGGSVSDRGVITLYEGSPTVFCQSCNCGRESQCLGVEVLGIEELLTT